MSAGLADYISMAPCPYPAIVAEWESIPVAQVESFTPPGFLRSDTFAGLGDYLQGWEFAAPTMMDSRGNGLGDLQMTAPGGYFSSGLDFTQWGMAEWGTTFAGVWVLFSTFWTTKSAVTYASVGRKRSKSRKKRIESAKKARGFF
jgi:hypothetical protein